MQSSRVRLKNPEWPAQVTSNPFVRGELARRGPVDVLRKGIEPIMSVMIPSDQYVRHMSLSRVQISMLSIEMDSTGVFDTGSAVFMEAAKREKLRTMLRHPIKSIRAQLRK